MAISPTEIRDWTIYRITNPQGRFYIGKSSVFKARMSNYRVLAGKVSGQPILYNSLKKHGFESHVIDILDTFSLNKKAV